MSYAETEHKYVLNYVSSQVTNCCPRPSDSAWRPLAASPLTASAASAASADARPPRRCAKRGA